MSYFTTVIMMSIKNSEKHPF